MKQLRKACEDYLKKQSWGMVSDVSHFSKRSKWDQLLEAKDPQLFGRGQSED